MLKRFLRWLLWRQEVAYRRRVKLGTEILPPPDPACRRNDPLDVHAPIMTRRQAQ